jgi:SAM-dependent methyltransferase
MNSGFWTMTEFSSDKELAFLHDLFIGPDWGERFATLIDEHVKLPAEGEALYFESGTGNHAIVLQERARKNLRFIGITENPEAAELARAKAAATKEPVDFRHQNLESLSLDNDAFDLVIADCSLLATHRFKNLLTEIVRVARPGAAVALVLPTASSYGEFFSVYWEALHNAGLIEQEFDVERLITQLPAVSDVEDLAEAQGLEEIESFTVPEEFDFESGEGFVSSPLVSAFLMNGWLSSVPANAKQRVLDEVVRIINQERHNAEFALTVKATLVMGRKARSN